MDGGRHRRADRSRARTIALALAFGLAAGRVHAHDPPQATDVLRTDDGRQVIVTNRGLIFGSPPDGEASLLCVEAMGLTATRPPLPAWTSDGALIVGSDYGLQRSRDDGCSFAPIEPFGTAHVTALWASRTPGPRVVIAVFDPTLGGIHRSDDGAATFERVLELGEDDFVYSLRAAPSDPETLYASGWQFGNGMGGDVRYLRRSRDAGESWERFELPLTEAEEHAEILDVHPDDPMELALRTVALDATTTLERVLISRDGGERFEVVLELESLHAGHYDAAGETLWIAARGGLWRSDSTRGSFSRLPGPEAMTCVVPTDEALLACGGYQGIAAPHDGVGRLDVAGDSFLQWLDFTQVGPIDCPPDTHGALLCEAPWRDWVAEIGTIATGTGNAGSDGPGDDLTVQDAGVLGGQGHVPESMVDTATDIPTNAGAMQQRMSQGADAGCSVHVVRTGSGQGWMWLVCGLLPWMRHRVRRRRWPAQPLHADL